MTERRTATSPRASRLASAGLLLPLAIALLAWLACAAVLGLHPSGWPPSLPTLMVGLGRAGQVLVPLLAALAFQASTVPLRAAFRLAAAAALWLGWTVVSAALIVLPARHGLDTGWTVGTALLQQLGLLTGVAAGWFVSPARAARIDARIAAALPAVRVAAVVGTLVVVFIPLAPDTLLLNLGKGWGVNSLPGYGKAVLAQFYVLLKAVILWVPLGMLYGFARRSEQLRSWAATAMLALPIAGSVLLIALLRIADLMEIAGGYLGIQFGLWIAANMRVAEDASEAASAAAGRSGDAPAAATQRLPAAADAPPPALAAKLPARLAAAAILLGSLAWAWMFPRWGPWLAGGLVLYALLLGVFRHAWLLVVPAALPLLNLAPATGRFYFDEFDLLLLATVAMALWHGRDSRSQPRFSRAFLLAAAIFALLHTASLAIGISPLEPIDPNAFASYWSQYNSLRVAKGFFWVLPVAAMVRWTLPQGPETWWRLLLPGMLIGLAGVIAVGLWERWLFASLFDLSIRYRITATFGSMHTGGSEIEIYLAMALPFAWLATSKGNPLAMRMAGAALLALGTYLMTLTIARGGILALAVIIVILALAGWRAQADRLKGWVSAAPVLLSMAVVLFVGLGGGYLQARFASAKEDWAIRAAHWEAALAMRDDDAATALFGMGLGRFPSVHLFRSGATPPPGTYRFAHENGNTYLRLGGGETLYMAQRVSVTGGQRFTLTLRVRGAGQDARLGVPVCEKHLLDSFRCQWQTLAVPGDGRWHSQSISFDSGQVGSGNLLTRRPVELSMFNDTPGVAIDVDDVQLQDPAGRPLIRNGDFSAGGDYWFFKTHDHLPWHIKNLWASLLFEQGWLGLIAFAVLLGVVAYRLAPALWRGDRLASALLAALGGFLTVGIVGSPFDAPRIGMLFFLLLVIGDAVVGDASGRAAARLKRPDESQSASPRSYGDGDRLTQYA